MKSDDVTQANGIGAAHRRLTAAPAIVRAGDERDVPATFDLPDLPGFPVDALPNWMRAMVEALALETETPVDVASMLGLSILATACARRLVVEPRPGYQEQLCLYVLCALHSGNRKSSVFKRMRAPVEAYEKELAKQQGPIVLKARAMLEVLESRFEAAKGKLAKEESPSERMALEFEIAKLAEEIAATPEPVLPQLIVNDITTEKLAILLATHGRMAVLDDEGGLFETMAGRYSRNGGANIDAYLKGHDGGPLRVSRVNREDFIAERPALTIGMTVQPEVLRSMGDKSGFRGRGLIARFLFALPRSLVGERTLTTPTLPAEISRAYDREVTALLSMPDPGDVPRAIVFSAEAHDAWLSFAQRVEPRRHERGDLGNMADWASKLDGAVARIVGLLHAADHPHEPWAWPVGASTVGGAIRIGEYLIEHAKAAFGQLGTDDVGDRAQRVIAWIRAKKLRSFKKRDLLKSKAAGIEDIKALDPILANLAERGIVTIIEPESSGKRGRPSGPVYMVANEVLQ